jgi:putative endonuclease
MIHYGRNKFTASAKDWIVFLTIPCNTISEAQGIEAHIKKMKSRKYIQDLKKYPEMVQKLKRLYAADIR